MTPTERHLRAAKAEFDLIGSKAFLAKYAGGYAPKAHYVIIDNIKYPMKALWRATLITADANRRMQTSHARSGLKRLGYIDFWSSADPTDEEDLEAKAKEGTRYLAEVRLLQRSKTIVAAAKRKWPAVCMACGFNFAAVYGDLGAGYIECHHINPIADRDEEGVITHLEELRLLCANCHRMVHQRNPCLTVEELKEWIKWAPLEPILDIVIVDD